MNADQADLRGSLLRCVCFLAIQRSTFLIRGNPLNPPDLRYYRRSEKSNATQPVMDRGNMKNTQ